MSWVLEGSAPGGGLAFTSGSLEISLVPETQVKFELTFCDGSQGRLILPSLSRGSSQGPPAFLAPRAPARPSPLSGCAPCLSVPMAPWARSGEGRTGGAMQGADGELAGQLPVRARGSPRTASSRAVPTRLRWTLLFSPLTDEETEARSGRSGSNRREVAEAGLKPGWAVPFNRQLGSTCWVPGTVSSGVWDAAGDRADKGVDLVKLS